MSDDDCVAFLRWALPRLGRRWAGYRKVRRQVCRRARRRAAELGLAGLDDYRLLLERDPDEWRVLDGLANVTISRFARDRGLWSALERRVLPALAGEAGRAGSPVLSAWSAGCASGEEPYTLALLWQLSLASRFPHVELQVLASDVDAVMLERARAARYPPGSLKDLPEAWRREAFQARGDELELRPHFRHPVQFTCHDIRTRPPTHALDLVLCRNLLFTYFDQGTQREALTGLTHAIRPGGALVVGAHERLPDGVDGFAAWPDAPGAYRRVPADTNDHGPRG